MYGTYTDRSTCVSVNKEVNANVTHNGISTVKHSAQCIPCTEWTFSTLFLVHTSQQGKRSTHHWELHVIYTSMVARKSSILMFYEAEQMGSLGSIDIMLSKW